MCNALSQLDKAIVDSTQLLQMFERVAHSINLSDKVDRNMNIPPHRVSNAIVSQGTLRSEGTRLTVKTVRACLPAGNKQVIEVLAVHLPFRRI